MIANRTLTGLIEVLRGWNSNISHEIIRGPHHFHMSNPEETALAIQRFLANPTDLQTPDVIVNSV